MGDRDETDIDEATTSVLDTVARVEFEESLRSRLGEIFGAQPWLIGAEIEQGAVRLAADLQATGGQSVLAVGARPGVGPMDDKIPLISMNLPDAGSMVDNIHSAHARMADPPAEVQALVDAWDPGCDALALCGLTYTAGPVLGRRSFGTRPASWLELEDKLAIEELWASAGIPVAPSAQVELADTEALASAHNRLASELGTVWAADNTKGWHGGGHGTFWVPDASAVAEMREWLSGYVTVRIMPFLEGIPCSIHGMVLPVNDGRSAEAEGAGAEVAGDRVAVFRPCEMMMLRDMTAHRLVYGRVSSYWDPRPADRLAMQDTARKIGAELRRAVGYRRVFTVDGIMAADGFRPTEVNTRYGAALPSKMETVSGRPLDLFQIHLALVEGLLDEVDLEPLERWATANLDASRRAIGFLATDRSPQGQHSARVRRDRSGTLTLEAVTGDTDSGSHTDSPESASGPIPVLADVEWGSAPEGGLVIVEAKCGFPVGQPTAPLLLEILDVVDAAWNIDAPTLVAARQVR